MWQAIPDTTPAVLAQASQRQETFSWWEWHWHTDLYSGLMLFLGLYLLYTGPLRNRLVGAGEEGPSGWQVLSFVTAVGVMLFSLAGPIHELSDNYLFSAHMVQHSLITLVVPPLLLIGTPGWLLRPLVTNEYVLRAGRFATRPLVAFLTFNVVLNMWHFPIFYEGALREHPVHIIEHLLFMSAAVIAWWPVLSPVKELPRISYPAQILYLVALSISQTPLFAALTFSNDVLYSFYETAPRVWDISPLADQQLGGIIMKVSWLSVFLPAICILFLRWFYREEREHLPEFQPS